MLCSGTTCYVKIFYNNLPGLWLKSICVWIGWIFPFPINSENMHSIKLIPTTHGLLFNGLFAKGEKLFANICSTCEIPVFIQVVVSAINSESFFSCGNFKISSNLKLRAFVIPSWRHSNFKWHSTFTFGDVSVRL